MTISRRKLVGAAGLLPPFAAALTLSSAVKASEPETSDAESCSVAVIGAGAAGLAAAIAAKEAGAVRVVPDVKLTNWNLFVVIFYQSPKHHSIHHYTQCHYCQSEIAVLLHSHKGYQ